jgi:peptidyl-prolyl cis-trans isomerase A (cyclophilin A)
MECRMKAMKNRSINFLLSALLGLFSTAVMAQANCFPEDVMPDNLFPSVRLETSMGDIVIELNRLRAPATANNFLRYVTEGQYNGTIFHRVIPEFVIQTGGYTESIEERDLYPPVLNESGNGLKNMPMTVAMARYDDPHSATSQFFINMSVNSSLDPSAKNWGYTVFGQVVSGEDVATAISQVETGYNEGFDASDVPVQTITLISATVLEEPH